jgi:hypothetical protein
MKTRNLFLGACMILVLAGCGSREEKHTVMQGVFRQSFIESGELDAISAVAIMMPQIRWEYGYDFKIMDMVETGQMVQKGDTVIRIDPSSIEKLIISREEDLESARAVARKKRSMELTFRN